MAKKKKIKAQVGDIFAISIGNGKYCFGQVVSAIVGGDKIIPYTYIVYDCVGELNKSIENIRSSSIMLLFNTVDMFIEDGVWPLIGHEEIPQNLKFPEYKALRGGAHMVIGIDNQVRRVATPEEIKTLDYMESVSPGTVERLLKARFGEGEWKDHYEELFYRG